MLLDELWFAQPKTQFMVTVAYLWRAWAKELQSCMLSWKTPANEASLPAEPFPSPRGWGCLFFRLKAKGCHLLENKWNNICLVVHITKPQSWKPSFSDQLPYPPNPTCTVNRKVALSLMHSFRICNILMQEVSLYEAEQFWARIGLHISLKVYRYSVCLAYS